MKIFCTKLTYNRACVTSLTLYKVLTPNRDPVLDFSEMGKISSDRSSLSSVGDNESLYISDVFLSF